LGTREFFLRHPSTPPSKKLKRKKSKAPWAFPLAERGKIPICLYAQLNAYMLVHNNVFTQM